MNARPLRATATFRKTPAFWRHGAGGWRAALLAPLGWLYGRITLARMGKPGWRAPRPVIAIGNFTAGGAGKTPTAMALAQALLARGETPFFITRGYGGRALGPVRVEQHSAAEVGDEALLLARVAPTIVARDRAAGARLALAQGASCVLLDDALQNPALVKDFTLAVVDGTFGLGNGFTLPAGPLRAPLAGQLRHVSAVMVVGAGGCLTFGDVPVFCAHLQRDGASDALRDQRVISFCGLGLPEKFEATLRDTGADVLASHRFADHHAFTDAEAQALLDDAEKAGARLVTTAKDHVRLAGSPALEALAAKAEVLSVTMVLPPAVSARIADVIAAFAR
jgi:tetraacyldisaccharide 4'-kinase